MGPVRKRNRSSGHMAGCGMSKSTTSTSARQGGLGVLLEGLARLIGGKGQADVPGMLGRLVLVYLLPSSGCMRLVSGAEEGSQPEVAAAASGRQHQDSSGPSRALQWGGATVVLLVFVVLAGGLLVHAFRTLLAEGDEEQQARRHHRKQLIQQRLQRWRRSVLTGISAATASMSSTSSGTSPSCGSSCVVGEEGEGPRWSAQDEGLEDGIRDEDEEEMEEEEHAVRRSLSSISIASSASRKEHYMAAAPRPQQDDMEDMVIVEV